MTGKEKILIVEDDDAIYQKLVDFFTNKGLYVIPPCTGNMIADYETAITAIADEKPDVALLDIELPGKKDGIDLGIQLKEEYNIPVLYLSAHQDKTEYIRRIKDAEQYAFVVKTLLMFDKEQLWTTFEMERERVQKLIAESRHETSERQKAAMLLCERIETIDGKSATDIRQQHTKYRVVWEDIEYIDCRKEKGDIIIYESGDKYHYRLKQSSSMYLGKLKAMLPSYFQQITNHEIINCRKVTKASISSAYIGTREYKIPAGAYRKQFQEKMKVLYHHMQ